MALDIIAKATRTNFTSRVPQRPEDKLIVLTVGVVGDFAAYEGPASWGEHLVARQGDKVDRKTAEVFFPQHVTPEASYRR